MHGYLTRDGVSPAEFLRLARAELGRYGTVECRELEIVEATREDGGFAVCAADGTRINTRKLLLATGVIDELPAIEGPDALYGTSVHHCPYCDAWEWRDRPMAAFGDSEAGVGAGAQPDLLVARRAALHRGAELPDDAAARLAAAGVRIGGILCCGSKGGTGGSSAVVFASGEPAPNKRAIRRCRPAAAEPPRRAARLPFTERGTVDTGTCEGTNVPGLFVAGDASKDAQFVAVAAAEGTEAGMAIHRALMKDELP